MCRRPSGCWPPGSTCDTGIDEIARRVGLGTTANFRTRFRNAIGTSPTAYRRTFGDQDGRASRTPG